MNVIVFFIFYKETMCFFLYYKYLKPTPIPLQVEENKDFRSKNNLLKPNGLGTIIQTTTYIICKGYLASRWDMDAIMSFSTTHMGVWECTIYKGENQGV
jgi:hypothetical protein